MLALIDESHYGSTKHYLLSSVMFELINEDDYREIARAVKRRSKNAFHWRDESDKNKFDMIDILNRLEHLSSAVVAMPIGIRRQTRARAKCLERAVTDLRAGGAQRLLIESRGRQDQQDKTAFGHLRRNAVLPATTRFDFGTKSEPLLWLADAVGGVVGDSFTGDSRFLDALHGGVHVVHLGPVP